MVVIVEEGELKLSNDDSGERGGQLRGQELGRRGSWVARKMERETGGPGKKVKTRQNIHINML